MTLACLRGGLFVRLAEAGRGKYGVDLEDPVEEELGRTLLFLSVDVFWGWSAMLLVTCTKAQQRTMTAQPHGTIGEAALC